ncbi:E3 binding domain-containing protein, partial [Mesorhizobium qingshengii]
MPTEVILPKVDMDMATGQISRWFAEEGARVKKGDVLFEIETDKAAMEIDAPASGVLRNVTGKEGIDIPVGAPVAWIYADGEAYGAKQDAAPVKVEAPTSLSDGGGRATGAGGGEPTAATPTPVGRPADPPHKGEGEGRARATPLARRLAREAGLSLSALAGTGPHGRVVKADVDAAIAGGGARPAAKA